MVATSKLQRSKSLSIDSTKRRRPFLSKLSAWAGVVALVLQTLAPLAQMPLPVDVALTSFGGPMALCLASADGGKTTPADHDKAPIGKAQPCAICLSLQLISGFLPPSVEAMAAPPRYATRLDRLADLAVPVRWTASSSQPRAPPIPA